MEDIWDNICLILAVLFLVVGLVRLIRHFVRPVTWRDGEGPVINDEGRGRGFPIAGGPSNGGTEFLYYLVDLVLHIFTWRR